MPGFVINSVGGHESAPSGRREYYYNYFWEIIQIGWGPLGPEAPRSDNPLISLKDASLPTFTVNKENYQGSSLEYKFAKSVTWDDIKITWYDTLGLLQKIKEWRESIWTQRCGLGQANKYKQNSIIRNYLPTGQGGVFWILVNSWPSVIRSGELTYTSSDVKLIEVTLTYDWAEDRYTAVRENPGITLPVS
jgi:hypothetical protein